MKGPLFLVVGVYHNPIIPQVLKIFPSVFHHLHIILLKRSGAPVQMPSGLPMLIINDMFQYVYPMSQAIWVKFPSLRTYR